VNESFDATPPTGMQQRQHSVALEARPGTLIEKRILEYADRTEPRKLQFRATV
jgi:hypothetical protein